MLPDPNNSPTSLPEALIRFTVPLDVPGDLAFPILAVVFWHSEMPRAAVPEATIDENGETFAAKDKIWFARHRLPPPPSGDAMGAENGSEPQFCGAVSGGADCGHDLRSLFFGEHVGHRRSCSTGQAD